jgi:hypothetical protein
MAVKPEQLKPIAARPVVESKKSDGELPLTNNLRPYMNNGSSSSHVVSLSRLMGLNNPAKQYRRLSVRVFGPSLW